MVGADIGYVITESCVAFPYTCGALLMELSSSYALGTDNCCNCSFSYLSGKCKVEQMSGLQTWFSRGSVAIWWHS